MEKEKIEKLRDIIKRNPEILDSLHPLQKQMAMELCKGLDTPPEGRRTLPANTK